jgi:hypothetical protein
MVNKNKFTVVFGVPILASCAVILATGPGKPVFRPRTAGVAAVTKLKRALKVAAQRALTPGFPSFGADPYLPVLKVLKDEKNRLPAIWQAKALARYAAYLNSPALSFTSTVTEEALHRRSMAILHRAVVIAPTYTNGWVMLAREAMSEENKAGRAAFSIYLLHAYNTDPKNPYVQALRAWEIMVNHGGHNIHSGPINGNLGFLTQKWIRAFCFRAMVYLADRNPSTDARVMGQGNAVWVSVCRAAVKYYEPKQLTYLEAGKWKPGPCPDPWPPPMHKPPKSKSINK